MFGITTHWLPTLHISPSRSSRSGTFIIGHSISAGTLGNIEQQDQFVEYRIGNVFRTKKTSYTLESTLSITLQSCKRHNCPRRDCHRQERNLQHVDRAFRDAARAFLLATTACFILAANRAFGILGTNTGVGRVAFAVTHSLLIGRLSAIAALARDALCQLASSHPVVLQCLLFVGVDDADHALGARITLRRIEDHRIGTSQDHLENLVLQQSVSTQYFDYLKVLKHSHPRMNCHRRRPRRNHCQGQGENKDIRSHQL